MGGAGWGGARPPETPESRLVPFFCLLCLNNYSKIFQKCRISKWSLRGTHVRYPFGGAPPGPLGPPPGVPGCQRVLEKIAKILKQYIKNLHASKYPKFKLEHLFWATWVMGGGPNSPIWFFEEFKGFFSTKFDNFFAKWLVSTPWTTLGWWEVSFLKSPFYHNPLV